MSCVNIRGCCIGEGRPKVIIPIIEPTEAAILEKAAEFSTLRADCVEWRIDCFEGAKDLSGHCALRCKASRCLEGSNCFFSPSAQRPRAAKSLWLTKSIFILSAPFLPPTAPI